MDQEAPANKRLSFPFSVKRDYDLTLIIYGFGYIAKM